MRNSTLIRDGGTYFILSYIRCFYYSAKYDPQSDKEFLVGLQTTPGELFKADVDALAKRNGYRLADVYRDSIYTVYKFIKIA